MTRTLAMEYAFYYSFKCINHHSIADIKSVFICVHLWLKFLTGDIHTS